MRVLASHGFNTLGTAAREGDVAYTIIIDLALGGKCMRRCTLDGVRCSNLNMDLLAVNILQLLLTDLALALMKRSYAI